MWNSKVIGSFLIAGAGLVSTSAVAQQALTGDQGLACGAILCLSSPARPGECAPPLDRYFGISFDRWSDTVQGRLDFLNLCPTAGAPGSGGSQTVDKNMPTLIQAISQGAGRCDSEFLNKYNKKEITVRVQDREGNWTRETRTVVDDKKPYYCTQFQEHQYTYQLQNKYIGTPEAGGFWVEAKDYEARLAEYNAAIEKSVKEAEKRKRG